MLVHLAIGRSLVRLTILAALVTLAAGCDRVSGGARIEVTYKEAEGGREKSKDPQSFAAPAKATWCPGSGRLEVTAVREDMGFGLVLYPVDSLVAGGYPAFDPGIDTARRPGAAGVARWYTDQKLVGLQSDSGALKLARNGDRYDASFSFRLRSLDANDTTRVTGHATGLRPGVCAADSLPGTAPRQ
ncbi:MAG: hypothetical protein ABI742_12380 [Gemmatimonadota bacterium]